jgi:uncharacterized protein (DUF983 family)
MLKGTKVYSITRSKCPRCMEGEIYPDKNPYRFKTMTDFNPHCSVCDQNFEPEPNFYYGAMYVSYGYTVALFVAVYIIFGVWMGWTMWPTVGALAVMLVLLAPVIFRISRTTWLSMFVKYDKNFKKNG